jgi:hypothetical protein
MKKLISNYLIDDLLKGLEPNGRLFSKNEVGQLIDIAYYEAKNDKKNIEKAIKTFKGSYATEPDEWSKETTYTNKAGKTTHIITVELETSSICAIKELTHVLKESNKLMKDKK